MKPGTTETQRAGCIMNRYYVTINAGKFDYCISEFATETGASRYIDVVQPECLLPLEIKQKDTYRPLKEKFINEDILVSISV